MYLVVASASGSLRIHYTLEGKGDPLILLHGWGQNLLMMKFISDYFKQRFQVLNLDLPGFGESDEPPCVWNVSDYMECIYQCKEQLGLGTPILIAHSFGARIALYYASQYAVEKMVLTGAAGIKDRRTLSYYVKVYTYKLLKHFRKQIAMGSTDFQQASDVMKGVLVQSVNEDLRPLLGKINVQTLLIWGENDKATPLWMGEEMAEKIKHASLIVLDDDDHFAYFHQPQRFLAILEYFL